MGLTHEQRKYLKREVSAVLKGRLANAARLPARSYQPCKECGTDFLSWTKGCKVCRERHYRRHVRGTYPGGAEAFKIASRANRENAGQNTAYRERYERQIRAKIISSRGARKASGGKLGNGGNNSTEKKEKSL